MSFKVVNTFSLPARGLGMKVIAYDPYVLGPVMESRRLARTQDRKRVLRI